jgi:hypothetical protein
MKVSGSNSDVKNWVYYSTSQALNVVAVGAQGDPNTDVAGAEICNADGHSNLYTCGSVYTTNATVPYGQDGNVPPATLYNMRMSTVYDQPGDSGSSVISTGTNVTAVGVVSGTGTINGGQYCIYSHVYYLYQLGAQWSIATS